ncbi:recombination protein NinB [Neptunomonas sp. XY-337]|uniref:recombination protein NinB n=1 Tax=Neptunomonas sp. XY-337 TaxID=2561897 RepID=UPI0010AB2757|nr:recombination protein NinB [Neptunomonas sp. XY-337]
MSKQATTIRSESQLRPVMTRAWEIACAMVKAGKPCCVSITEESKTRTMEKKYHAMIGDIAKQVTFFGKKRYSQDVWKALLVDQFEQEKLSMGEPLTHPGQLITSMDGRRTITVRPTTTKFRKSEAVDFVEFLYAQGCEMGVQWSEPALAVYEEYYDEMQKQNRRAA